MPNERTALDFLAARGIPLVINSSRTRAEIERLHQKLQMLTPFISEHGAALFIPDGCFPSVPGARPASRRRACDRVRPAVPRSAWRRLRLTCRGWQVEIVGFAELTIEDVARELGVTIVEAQVAKLREYTELFRIVDETEANEAAC